MTVPERCAASAAVVDSVRLTSCPIESAALGSSAATCLAASLKANVSLAVVAAPLCDSPEIHPPMRGICDELERIDEPPLRTAKPASAAGSGNAARTNASAYSLRCVMPTSRYQANAAAARCMLVDICAATSSRKSTCDGNCPRTWHEPSYARACACSRGIDLFGPVGSVSHGPGQSIPHARRTDDLTDRVASGISGGEHLYPCLQALDGNDAAATALQEAFLLAVSCPGLVGAQDVTELLPRSSGPALKLQLRVSHAVVRSGIDGDSRNQRRKRKPADAARLFHDVLTRKIIAALLQHLFENLALLGSEQIVGVADIRAGRYFSK